MMIARIPDSEENRLKTLHAYNVVDTLAEPEFDDLTLLAAKICRAPIALVSLVDGSRQWFKSTYGIHLKQTSRETSFCAHTILEPEGLLVTDAKKDIRFFDNPEVTDGLEIRFYAGAPLIAPNGERVGSICVIDKVARDLQPGELAALQALARQTVSLLELRKVVSDMNSTKVALERTNAELHAAAAARSQFAANMAHEIRTPMNGVLGVTEILIHSSPAPEQLENLLTIQRCGNSLMRVLDDVLDLSKIEKGMATIEKAPCDIRVIAGDVVSLFKPLAEKKNLQLKLNLPEEIPATISGDGARIRQILSNLINNAIKFTARGSVELNITLLGPALTSKSRVRFAIVDTGVGIAEDVTRKLFKEFVQADSSVSRIYGGTGLGLAISQALCVQMNSHIEVTSVIDKGSTFSFSLECGDYQTRRLRDSDRNYSLKLKPQKKMKIVLADDNPLNQKIAASMLKILGHDVVVAENGLQVIELLKAQKYDLVLMDLQMPELDGLEAAKRIIATTPKAERPPIAALSAHEAAEKEVECLAAGMDAFLTKPLTLEKLGSFIAKMAS